MVNFFSLYSVLILFYIYNNFKDSFFNLFFFCFVLGESLSSDSIRGSLKLFERWGVLECQHEGKNKLYYLNDSYDNDTEIRKVLERIHKYKL